MQVTVKAPASSANLGACFDCAGIALPIYNYIKIKKSNDGKIKVTIDDERAMALGVNISDIYSTMAAQLGSSYINDFNQFGRVYRVYIQADSQFREQKRNLEGIYVRNNNGGMVPLTALVKLEDTTGPYTISRYNMYPAVLINGTAANNISSGQAMAEMEKLSDKYLDLDMGYEWSGTSLQEKESSGQIGPILALALTFVYLFLVALYEIGRCLLLLCLYHLLHW